MVVAGYVTICVPETAPDNYLDAVSAWTRYCRESENLAVLTWFIKVWVKIGLCVKHKLMLIKSGILGNSFEVFTVIVCYNIIIVVV